MSDKELLPCPFCGGKAERVTLEDEANFGGDVIICTACDACSHVEFGEKEGLTSAWNRRAGKDQQSMIDQLRADVEALRKDAERYRWLRAVGEQQLNAAMHHGLQALDRFVGAAMAAKEGV